MADYKSIHGTTIKSYTTDPDNPIEGQVWYDKTNEVLQYQIPNFVSAWATSTAVNTGRIDGAGAGTSTSSLFFSGAPYPVSAYTESWNGTSWTEVADLNTTRQQGASAGSSNTAALVFGGETSTAKSDHVEEWNGSSFSEKNDLNTARDQLAGVGHFSSTAILGVGGKIAPGSNTAIVEEWNGTSFTEIADLINGTKKSVGVGTTSSALNIGGGYPG